MRLSFPKLLPFSLLLMLSCDKADEAPQPITPENLTFTAEISEDGSGKVDFTASATNTVSYKFYFGDDNSAPTTSTDGTAQHIYAATNTYTARVVATSKDELFVSKDISVNVVVKEIIPTTGYTSPEAYEGMTLVWQDDFSGTSLNDSFWTHETGTGCPNCGWGNNELEYYQAKNTSVADGYLTIRAKKESVGGMNYTSSRIISRGKKAFKYGRVDIRAVLPKGQGIWPALWMLGSNITSVGWPKCGEIDIMEMIGGGSGRDNKVYGTAHWDQSGYKSYGGNYTLPDGKILADEFHVYSIKWTASRITWLIDNIEYHTIDTTPEALSEFREEFFFIMNVAVGGNWPGSPDANTTFPQRMIVDYIRVFQ